jgi:hypothetical protein
MEQEVWRGELLNRSYDSLVDKPRRKYFRKLKEGRKMKEKSQKAEAKTSPLGHIYALQSGKIEVHMVKGMKISEIAEKTKLSMARVKQHIYHIQKEHSDQKLEEKDGGFIKLTYVEKKNGKSQGKKI